MNSTEPFKAVIFDLDNTLVHSRIDFPAMKATLLTFAQKNGVVLPIKDLYSTAEIMIGILSKSSSILSMGKQAEQIISDYELAGLVGSTVEESASSVLRNLIDHGISVGVFTNNIAATTFALLEQFGLLGLFNREHILCRDELPWTKIKPSGYGLRLLLKRMQMTPAMTCMVGDSWVDGRCSEEAGVRFIAVGPKSASIDPALRWATAKTLAEVPMYVLGEI